MTYFADHDIHFDDSLTTTDGLTYEQYCKLPLETRLARLVPDFVGFGVPCEKSHANGGTVTCEKILKFEKAQKPQGLSDAEQKAARLAKLDSFYNNAYNVENEISPFDEE